MREKWILITAGAALLAAASVAGLGGFGNEQAATVADWAAKMKPLLRMDDGTPITTVAAWRAHREEILKRTLSGWGQAPASRPPLVIERLSSVDAGTYVRHTIRFFSEPDDPVKAYLCLPKNPKGKVPGVLAIHSTTPLGKDQPAGLGGVPSRFLGKELAERGYAVLMPDEIVAGERLLGATTTWDTAPFYARHPEWSALGKAVWDSRLFIDVLLAQPEVDPDRIASIGHSQGAIYTVLTMAFDERVKAGIASCGYWPHFGDIAREGAEGRGRWVRPKGWVGTPHMRALFEAGKPFPYDWHELAACASPRALFFHCARNDYGAVPESIEATFLEIAKVNELLGSPADHLHPVWSPGGHDFPDGVRAQAYAWLDRTFSFSRADSGPKDLGNGFRDHGVAVPISNQRGAAAALDGQGRNALLVLLMDHRGGYSLLMLDVQTGRAEQFPVPFPPPGESVDSPYASLLSSGNKFYTHFKNHLLEFDPVKRAFTFSKETTRWFAMSMTEDDGGRIWTITYPQCGVISFDPRTRELKDYGEVHRENWAQYPNSVATDDAGWVYFGLGHTSSQIVIFDPSSGKATTVLAEAERRKGAAYVYRDLDGKVYGQALRGEAEDWIELYKGASRKIGKRESRAPKKYFVGTRAQEIVFPDGTKADCDLVRRLLTVENPKTGEKKEFSFDYESDGAIIMGEAAAPNGTIGGGTAFPMHFFSLDPARDALSNRPGFGQWNIVRASRDRLFIGSYGGGHLLEWDPSKPWVDTDPKKSGGNPAYLGTAEPEINRPSQILVTMDEKLVVMSGTPAYGSTGGGLLFWDREKRAGTVLRDAEIVPDQSTFSMLALPDGKMLAGTTTSPGTGGEKKAAEAVLYIMDLAARRIEWQAAVLPGVQDYSDLTFGPEGLVYGIADRKIFFVFDPARKTVVAKQDVEAGCGRAAHHQGPRVFVAGPEGAIYAIFSKGIARVEAKTNTIKLIAASPVPIDTGGDYFKGRIYFSSGSHLLSWKVESSE